MCGSCNALSVFLSYWTHIKAPTGATRILTLQMKRLRNRDVTELPRSKLVRAEAGLVMWSVKAGWNMVHLSLKLLATCMNVLSFSSFSVIYHTSLCLGMVFQRCMHADLLPLDCHVHWYCRMSLWSLPHLITLCILKNVCADGYWICIANLKF